VNMMTCMMLDSGLYRARRSDGNRTSLEVEIIEYKSNERDVSIA
jgi:hypothetical protein